MILISVQLIGQANDQTQTISNKGKVLWGISGTYYSESRDVSRNYNEKNILKNFYTSFGFFVDKNVVLGFGLGRTVNEFETIVYPDPSSAIKIIDKESFNTYSIFGLIQKKITPKFYSNIRLSINLIRGKFEQDSQILSGNYFVDDVEGDISGNEFIFSPGFFYYVSEKHVLSFNIGELGLNKTKFETEDESREFEQVVASFNTSTIQLGFNYIF